MKKLAKMLPVFCLLLQVSVTHAEIQKTIQFENQRDEVFDLENWLKETTYTTEEVKDTCSKQVPYEEKICADETKYKKECKSIPSHEECKDVNRPICHNETHEENECTTPTHRECHTESTPSCHYETRYDNVCSTTRSEEQCTTVYEPDCRIETRYENECQTVPGEEQCQIVIRYHEECSESSGGQVCHQVPPDIKCEIINGENKCQKIPAHEECSESSGRRTCHQAPYEERECTTGSAHQECHQRPIEERICENRSRQECTTIPGHQECHQESRQEEICSDRSERVCEDIPDDEICHKVPKTEKVCVDHMEKECKTVPTKDVCKNVPYQENVCKMETKYKDVSYECTKKIQVPHESIVKTHKAHIQMNFDATKALEANTQFKIALNTKGELEIKSTEEENSHLFIFAKKKIKSQDVGSINSIDALFNISLIEGNDYFKFLESGINNVELKKRSVSFLVAGKIDLKRAKLNLIIGKKDKIKFQKMITGLQITSDYDGENTTLTVDLEKFNAPKLGGLFNREHTVQLNLKLDYSDLGENLVQKDKEFSISRTVILKVD